MGAAYGKTARLLITLLTVVLAILMSKLFIAELRRDLRLWWSYRMQAISSLALWLVAFPFVMFTFDSAADGYGPERQAASLIGFLIWELCTGILTTTTDSITTESRQGTLENVVLTPLSPLTLFSLRIMAVFTRKAVETTLLGLCLMLLLGLFIVPNGLAQILVLLTFLGVAGISLLLGGLALIYKNINSFVSVIAFLAVLFTGALVPLNSLGPVFVILKLFLPMTWGIDALRQVLIQQATWDTLWHEGTLLGLAIQTAVFLVIGILVFNWGFHHAQRQGSLGAY